MKDLHTEVRVRLLKKQQTIRYMAIRLGLNYDYLLQVLTGKRNNEEYVSRVKDYLGIKDQESK